MFDDSVLYITYIIYLEVKRYIITYITHINFNWMFQNDVISVVRCQLFPIPLRHPLGWCDYRTRCFINDWFDWLVVGRVDCCCCWLLVLLLIVGVAVDCCWLLLLLIVGVAVDCCWLLLMVVACCWLLLLLLLLTYTISIVSIWCPSQWAESTTTE